MCVKKKYPEYLGTTNVTTVLEPDEARAEHDRVWIETVQNVLPELIASSKGKEHVPAAIITITAQAFDIADLVTERYFKGKV